MIIGIDASRANRKRKTGTEWYAFYLIKELAKIDSRNRYILYLDAPAAPDMEAIVKDNPNFSFKVLAWPFNNFWTLGRLTLEMIFKRPDVLFVPSHTLPLIYPKKTITTIHDVAFARESDLYRRDNLRSDSRWPRTVFGFLVKVLTRGRYHLDSVDYLHWSTAFALRCAARILTVSEFTKREILELYPQAKGELISVIHNGYPADLFHEVLDEKRIASVLGKYGLEKPYFLYVGRIEKKKNSPYLIDALAMLRENRPEMDAKLVMIGNAGYGYDEVKYLIEEFDLDKDVFMPGWVDERDLPAIFSGAIAFIFPTRHEGFGIPVIQALACGLPAAVSDIPVLREIAGDAVLYFDQKNRLAIARAMERIASDENLRVYLRTQGLLRAKEFSWEKSARATLSEIEKL